MEEKDLEKHLKKLILSIFLISIPSTFFVLFVILDPVNNLLISIGLDQVAELLLVIKSLLLLIDKVGELLFVLTILGLLLGIIGWISNQTKRL